MSSVKIKSNILVSIQFGMMFAIAFTGPLLSNNLIFLTVELLGVFLGLWAIYAMRIGNFNIRPIVKADGVLIERGPYKFIRHPMYAAIFLTFTPLVVESFSLLRAAFILILVINLCVKCRFEEGLLKDHFKEYADYMTRTKRIIPYIY